MSERAFSEHLREAVPVTIADEPSWQKAITAIAELVLQRTTWWIEGKPHRFTEVELYVNGPGHSDTFTHGDVMQREFARWYHHRTGSEYRGGTYKGLDLAFGRDDTFAGMLIRGVEAIDPPALFDGPCVCVDHLLALASRADVRSLVASYDGSVDEQRSSPSYLTVGASRSTVIYRSPRVGLSLKRGATAERRRYLAAQYRFLTEPARIKKGKLHVVCGLHRAGKSPVEIAAITGARLAQAQRYIAQYELGRERDPEEYRDASSTDETCQLFGACERFAPEL